MTQRLANSSKVLTDPAALWRRDTVPGCYGEGERVVKISTATAVRRHRKAIPRRDVSEADRGGMPIVPIRRMLVRDPVGRFNPQALLCTDPAQHPVQVLRWFVQRWQPEITSRSLPSTRKLRPALRDSTTYALRHAA